MGSFCWAFRAQLISQFQPSPCMGSFPFQHSLPSQPLPLTTLSSQQESIQRNKRSSPFTLDMLYSLICPCNTVLTIQVLKVQGLRGQDQYSGSHIQFQEPLYCFILWHHDPGHWLQAGRLKVWPALFPVGQTCKAVFIWLCHLTFKSGARQLEAHFPHSW